MTQVAVRAVDLGGREVLNLDWNRKDCVLSALVGERLGQGCYREVYAIKRDREHVLKVEVAGASFSNVMEWQVWERVQFTDLAKWFAPCVFIDQIGGALIQRRTTPMTRRVWERLEVPAFFTDLKPENWGLLSGRPVCHDYASNLLMERGMNGRKLRAVGPWY